MVGLVAILLQRSQAENVTLISFVGLQQNEDADQIRIAELLLALHHLAIALLLNLQERFRIELPRPPVDRLDLEWEGMT